MKIRPEKGPFHGGGPAPLTLLASLQTPYFPKAEPLWETGAPPPGSPHPGCATRFLLRGHHTTLLAPQPLGPPYSSPRGSPKSHISLCSTRNKVPRQLSLKAQLCIMDKGQPDACAGFHQLPGQVYPLPRATGQAKARSLSVLAALEGSTSPGGSAGITLQIDEC